MENSQPVTEQGLLLVGSSQCGRSFAKVNPVDGTQKERRGVCANVITRFITRPPAAGPATFILRMQIGLLKALQKIKCVTALIKTADA